MGFFVTSHGREFALDDGQGTDIRNVFARQVLECSIEEIAHSLSRQCRFQGHCREFYSVADHSVLVALIATEELEWRERLSDPGLVRAALLHDALEAFLPGGDIISPWKRQIGEAHPEFAEWLGGLERLGWSALADKFTLPDPIPDEVKRADLRALMTERRDLMAQPPWPSSKWLDHGGEEPEPHHRIIRPLCPEESESEFLRVWREVAL